MKAKDMFEALGYSLKDNVPFIKLYYNLSMEIEFSSLDETIYIDDTITVKLHQAIHQQMIELGWIKEALNEKDN